VGGRGKLVLYHHQLRPALQERLAASLAPPAMEIAAVAINNGLEFPFVISLAINSNGDVFAGTFEGAAFIARLTMARAGSRSTMTISQSMFVRWRSMRTVTFSRERMPEVPLAAYSARQMMVIVGRR